MDTSRGHVQEIKDDAKLTIAWRAVIIHPTKLTRAGSPKRLSRQYGIGDGVSSARAKKPDAYVFGTSTGNFDSLSNVRRAWISLLEITNEILPDGLEPLILPDGVPITSPYHSRHYHASEMLRSGVSLADVSERLGHADTVITQRHYAHLLGDRSQASREASDKFAAAMNSLAAQPPAVASQSASD